MNSPAPATHKKPQPPSPPPSMSRRVRLAIGTLITALAIAGALGGWPFTQPTTSNPASLSEPDATAAPTATAEDTHQVDVAIGQTLIAAARLNAFSTAPKGKQAQVLARTQDNLETATDALDVVDADLFGDDLDAARISLTRLGKVVTGLRECTDAETTKKPSKKPRTTKGSKSDRRSRSCAVTSNDVETARATGTAVFALLPHASFDAAALQDLSASVQAQVIKETAKGPGLMLVVPDLFVP